MPRRLLSADEHDAWGRLAATVTPLGARTVLQAGLPPPPLPCGRGEGLPAAAGGRPEGVRRGDAVPVRAATPADTLDGGWDRRLRRGVVGPDRTIDLHGHTLASAQAALETALGEAVSAGLRVLLVVTGKPPRAGEGRRGLIRASIFDWLGRSRHGAWIAAVRNAHPRHGGAGALYLILRRRRDG